MKNWKFGVRLRGEVVDSTSPQNFGGTFTFVGGGNTFRLLKGFYDFELLPPVRRRVAEGMPYIGSSAGSIVACPTLKTTIVVIIFL